MNVLAASALEAGEAFLHAGYISAYPRQLWSHAYPSIEPSLQLDVAEALKLKDEVAGLLDGSASDALAATVGAGGHWSTLLMGALLFFGALGLAHLARSAGRKGWAKGAPALGLLALAAGLACNGLPETPPWEGVAKKEYANPADATRVLLHGIVADGIINVGQPIESLANIQDEVGLPTKNPTPGERYALQTYGLDGWGRELRLTSHAEGSYEVTSAGPDGQFDNADDLKLAVSQCDDEDWDSKRHAFFLAQHAGGPAVVFHRWTGDHFEYGNLNAAKELTGNELFDLLPFDKFEASQQAQIQSAWQEASSGKSSRPLVLQVFKG